MLCQCHQPCLTSRWLLDAHSWDFCTIPVLNICKLRLFGGWIVSHLECVCGCKDVFDQTAMRREGFNAVFPLEHLKCLYEDEIETMLCGTREQWTVDMLADTIKFDHG